MKQDITLLAIPSMAAAHKVAVVGNSGNLLEKEDGDLIDSYDVVIRMNTFDISEKYAKHTGTKTTIWSNAMHFRVPFREDHEYQHMICPLPLNIPARLQRYGATNKKMFYQYRDKSLFMPEIYFEELTEKLINPSTGIATLFWLKKEGIKFDIFGFSFFDNKHNHHYHDDYKACGHNGSGEKRFFDKYLAN